MTEPQMGFYHHYKNPDRFYFVLGCATNRTTDEREVIYAALYNDDKIERLHTRLVSEWNNLVAVPYPAPCNRGAHLEPRFSLVKPTDELIKLRTQLFFMLGSMPVAEP